MARVPLQTELNQSLNIGSEVQLASGSVEPMKDVVSDDISRSAKALTNTGEIIQKLDDELNDAESRRLYNFFTADLNEISQEYLNKDGYEAVQVIQQENGKTVRAYDVANGNMEKLLGKYEEDASNGVVKYMFQNMAQVAIKNKQTLMTQHSIKQQRLLLDKETELGINNHAETAIENKDGWADKNSTFNTELRAGAELIKENAIRNGQNVEIGPNGEAVSLLYLENLSNYYTTVYEGVINRLKEEKNWDELKRFIAHIDPNGDGQEQLQPIINEIKKNHDDYNGELIVNAVLNSNNPTDYSFSNSIKILEGLSSNNNSDNNKGGSVISGFNTDEINVEELKTSERYVLFEKELGTSIFYAADSNKTLIPQHRVTHMFAVQRLGVKKADSLYTRAYNSVEFDKEKYNKDFDYRQRIDGKILDKYNELVGANVRRKYFLFDGKYADQVINDLEVLKNNISYVDIKTTDIVNEITGLQPIEVYQDKLRQTITDPRQLEVALENLGIEYKRIVEEKENAYNESLVAAQEIVASSPEGWKALKANGIDITKFTIKDQKILKDGQPEESDAKVEAGLIDDLDEVRDNIDSYRFQLSNTDYLKLKRLSETLTNENNYIEAKGNKDLMKEIMFRTGDYDWIYDSKKFNKTQNAKTFSQIYKEWVDRIDFQQINRERKLTRQEKEEILVNILNDKVNVQGTLGWGKERNVLQSTIIGREDDIYVNVDVLQETGKIEREQIVIADIPREIITEIMHSLFRRGEPMNQQNIAEEWVKFGKPENKDEAKKFIQDNHPEIYELMYDND